MTTPRGIQKAFLAREQAEGAGARVRRSIGTPQLKNFSPFLMLDHFTIKPGAGFPDHPHRGQETITYLLEGAVDHEDFAGNAGTIEAGDLQFMTAGKGIMHAEMPRQNLDGSANVGMQLWVDLPEKLKKCEPRYRDLRAKEIPQIDIDDGKVHVKIISGQSHGVDSVQELAYTPVWIFDVEIKPGGKIEQSLPAGWNAFAYTLSGETVFGSGDEKTKIAQFHNVVFRQEGDLVNAEVEESAKENGHFTKQPSIGLKSTKQQKVNAFAGNRTRGPSRVGCRVCKSGSTYARRGRMLPEWGQTSAEIDRGICWWVLVAGQPLDQKVVQYGPFVLNSEEEVYQAMMDFQTQSNGFERAKGWRSEIGKTMVH
ncbi:similar to pirin [Botrytis cinerea T4]|uniref:Similar to pirin n=1 Tax=Botryotinia fuckeliana (strain T4) TaxID=999810 RepID=G2Y8K5_BOTF4|nr:similar to pirin [Botrytis cinerea T4]